MWKYPRMVAWFLVTVVIIVLVRLPFIHTQIIPYYVDFNPGIVLVPIVGVFLGPAGVWGCFVASFVGDSLMGMWGPMSIFRGIGYFLFALSAKRLWDAYPSGAARGYAPVWRATFRFILFAWPGCLIAAAWSALGAEILDLYPFVYVFFLQLMNHLLFVTILGVALYRIFARDFAPYFGTWRSYLAKDVMILPLSCYGVILLVIGSLGACLAGLSIGRFVYGISLFQALTPGKSMFLGTASGVAVIAGVAPFMGLQLLGLFRRRKKG